MIRPSSPSLLSEIERARLGAGLTQADIARHLEISQAHYSKVSAGLVPLSTKLERRVRDLLASGELGTITARPADLDEIDRLSASIRRDTRQLLAKLRSLKITRNA